MMTYSCYQVCLYISEYSTPYFERKICNINRWNSYPKVPYLSKSRTLYLNNVQLYFLYVSIPASVIWCNYLENVSFTLQKPYNWYLTNCYSIWVAHLAIVKALLLPLRRSKWQIWATDIECQHVKWQFQGIILGKLNIFMIVPPVEACRYWYMVLI
jgi:hypothetical protein